MQLSMKNHVHSHIHNIIVVTHTVVLAISRQLVYAATVIHSISIFHVTASKLAVANVVG